MSLKLLKQALLFTAVLSVSSLAVNAQATAVKCKDGSTSASTGKGACSGHGGVNKAATKAIKTEVKREKKAAKEVAKAAKKAATVTSICADGTASNVTGRGACSGHGGVKGAEATSKKTGPPITTSPKASLPTPRASARARERANANSAVAAASGSAEDKNPIGATAQCKDGYYSHSRSRTGTCGHHGGVAKWM